MGGLSPKKLDEEIEFGVIGKFMKYQYAKTIGVKKMAIIYVAKLL